MDALTGAPRGLELYPLTPAMGAPSRLSARSELKQRCFIARPLKHTMSITTLSSRQLNQDLGRAKRAARNGPVIITDRRRPVHVLLSYDEYQRIIGQQESLIERLGLPPGIEDVEVEFPRSYELAQPADFT